MRVTFQIPIVDFRSMIPGANRLPIESFYRNGGCMVRHWGAVKNGVDYHVDNHVYCTARNSVKFRFTHPHRVQFKHFGTLTRCTPRRLYHLSEYGCCMEIGFCNLLEDYADRKEPGNCVGQTVRKYSRIPLGILSITDRNDPGWIEKPAEEVGKIYVEKALMDSGKWIAECFLYSSSRTEGVTVKVDKSLIKAGEPVCVAEFFKRKYIDIPGEARLIRGFEQFGFSLYHYNDNGKTSVWLICCNKGKYDRDKARQLKAGLFRIHAEIECLKHGLQYIDCYLKTNAVNSGEVAAVTKSLKKLTDKLLRERRFGIETSQLVAWAFDAVEMTTPGILKDLRAYAGELGDAYLVHDIQLITDSIDTDYKSGVRRVAEILESGTFLPGSAEYQSLIELREAFEKRWKIRARKILNGLKEVVPLLKDIVGLVKDLVPHADIKINLINIENPAEGKPPQAGQSV